MRRNPQAGRPLNHRILRISAVCFCLLIVPVLLAQAAIVLDGTLGKAGAILPSGTTQKDYKISPDFGRFAGNNLFQSFSQFDLSKGERAIFQGPNSVENIISRVTGGYESTINGTIRCAIPGANLYLINPSGLVFGANARLDVQGSFHASTADYVRLGDSGRFDATRPADSVFSAAPPSAFGFLTDHPAAISMLGGSLQVGSGQTLSFVGGDITMTNASLAASEGWVNLVGVASRGEAAWSSAGLAVDSFSKLGVVQLQGDSGCRVDAGGDKGGSVYIRGGHFVMTGGQIAADTYGDLDSHGKIDIRATGDIEVQGGGKIFANAGGNGAGVDVVLQGDNVSLSGGAQIKADSSGSGGSGSVFVDAKDFTMAGSGLDGDTWIKTQAHGSGLAGDVFLNARKVSLSNGAFIDSSTFSGGKAGDVHITAQDSISLSDGAFISSDSAAKGHAGNISIATGTLSLTGGSKLDNSTGGAGDAGVLTIFAKESVTLSGQSALFNNAFSDGHAGEISLTTAGLNLSDGSWISSMTFGTGNAGRIRLTVSGAISLTDGSLISTSGDAGSAGDISVSSHSLYLGNQSEISSTAFGPGKAGRIDIGVTNAITLSGGSDIKSDTFYGSGDADQVNVSAKALELFGGSRISTSTLGAGHGGIINIYVREGISISGFGLYYGELYTSGVKSEAAGSGQGGSISITSRDLSLSNQGRVSASSSGSGNAGNIFIRAANILSCNNGFLNTRADFAGGGNINIWADDIRLTRGSPIKADVGSAVGAAPGDGGHVTINATTLVALHNSDIVASAQLGHGGDITIDAQAVFRSPDVGFEASSWVRGQEGRVAINAPIVDLAGTLVDLPGSFLRAEAVTPMHCTARDPRESSTFLLFSLEGIPLGPEMPVGQ